MSEFVSVLSDSGRAMITMPGAEVAQWLCLLLMDCTFMLTNRDSLVFELGDRFNTQGFGWVGRYHGPLHQVAKIFCGNKYRHNSMENNYCGGKLGFVVSRLGLVGSVGLGLALVTSLDLGLRFRVSVIISSVGDKR